MNVIDSERVMLFSFQIFLGLGWMHGRGKTLVSPGRELQENARHCRGKKSICLYEGKVINFSNLIFKEFVFVNIFVKQIERK